MVTSVGPLISRTPAPFLVTGSGLVARDWARDLPLFTRGGGIGIGAEISGLTF